jgi:hypothetical protein
MARVLLIMLAAVACCGGTQHTQVQEAPIEQGGGHGGEGLPPDEIGDAGGTQSTVVFPDASAPPGIGPTSLDTVDAGAAATTGFVARADGLTEKDCTDLVLGYAKLTAKEKKGAAPARADIAKDAVYGPMLNDCGASTTKKQQKCALAAKTSAAWKKCLE